MSLNLDEMIMAVTAQPTETGVRLKYLAIAGGYGPSIDMPRELAEQTIQALQTALNGESYDSDTSFLPLTQQERGATNYFNPPNKEN